MDDRSELDLVTVETERIDSRFLEPACKVWTVGQARRGCIALANHREVAGDCLIVERRRDPRNSLFYDSSGFNENVLLFKNAID